MKRGGTNRWTAVYRKSCTCLGAGGAVGQCRCLLWEPHSEVAPWLQPTVNSLTSGAWPSGRLLRNLPLFSCRPSERLASGGKGSLTQAWCPLGSIHQFCFNANSSFSIQLGMLKVSHEQPASNAGERKGLVQPGAYHVVARVNILHSQLWTRGGWERIVYAFCHGVNSWWAAALQGADLTAPLGSLRVWSLQH